MGTPTAEWKRTENSPPLLAAGALAEPLHRLAAKRRKMQTQTRILRAVTACMLLSFLSVTVVHAEEPTSDPVYGDPIVTPYRLQPSAAATDRQAAQLSDAERAPSFDPPASRIGKDRHHSWLFITGLSILTASYINTVAWAAFELAWEEGDPDFGEPCVDCPAIRKLFIPVVGPWLKLATRWTQEPVISIIAGASQTLGLILTAFGVLLLTGPPARASEWTTTSSLSIGAAPTPGGGIATLRLTL
jgi:hypothetical protein